MLLVDLSGAAALRQVARRLAERGCRMHLSALPPGGAAERLVASLSALRALSPEGAVVVAERRQA